MSEVNIESVTTVSVTGPVGPVETEDAFGVVVEVVGPTGPVAPADADDILTYSLIR